MKQAVLLTVFFTVTQTIFARPCAIPCKEGSIETYGDSVSVFPGARQLLLEIISVTGLQPNFELKEAKVMNMEASVSRRKRYILYNPSFITFLHKVTRDKWAAMALLAHEVGHHLNGHTIRKSGSTPKLELEADEFAGFILYKLGASLEEAQRVMDYIAKTETSETHPGKKFRLLAIQNGWNKAASGDVSAKIVLE